MDDLFYKSDNANKECMLMQDHEHYDALAHALRTDNYAIVQVQAPLNIGTNAYNHGSAYIRYVSNGYVYYDTITIEVSRQWWDTVRAENGPVKLPHGELYARWSAPAAVGDLTYLRPPQRIADIINNLISTGARAYQNTEEMNRMHDSDRRQREMEYEADQDPEGAFGGRGNNYPI